MPRRMIDSEIWFNEKVASLPDAGRLLFIGIFSTADNEGRLRASPKYLKSHIFPYDDKSLEQIRELKDQCAKLGLIRVYSKNTREYLDIPGWYEHQSIRKDRFKRSDLPAFEEADSQPPPIVQPTSNQHPTKLQPLVGLNKGRGRGTKLSTPLANAKGARKKQADPTVNEIFAEMRTYLGFPDRVQKDPIPNYGKEGQAIKRMLTRGFTREEVTDCWKQKVDARGGEFVSMTWVNEDIGKKGGKELAKQPKQQRVKPITHIPGSSEAGPESEEDVP